MFWILLMLFLSVMKGSLFDGCDVCFLPQKTQKIHKRKCVSLLLLLCFFVSFVVKNADSHKPSNPAIPYKYHLPKSSALLDTN